MNRVLNLLLFCLATTICFGQTQLVVTNVKLNKMIIIREGHTLSLNYSGYLGQTETIKNMVTEITDSTITLLYSTRGMLEKADKNLPSVKTIRIADIRAFRRITVWRQLTKTTLYAGAIIGSYFVLYNLNDNSGASFGRDFVVSAGIGLGAKFLIDRIFPENAKNQMKDGWVTTVIHP